MLSRTICAKKAPRHAVTSTRHGDLGRRMRRSDTADCRLAVWLGGLDLPLRQSRTGCGIVPTAWRSLRPVTQSNCGRTVVSTRVAAGLALATGVFYFAAFPGIEVWPLAFVAFVPLFVALHGQSAWRGFLLASLSGFTMNMLGFYWLLGMLKTFSGFPTAICLLLMSILCLYQGFRIGAIGWLFCRAQRRGWPAHFAFVVAFAASELLFPVLFPWFFGATVHQTPLLLQTADLGGPILVGLVVVAFNFAVAEPILARLERRAIRPKIIGLSLGFCLLAVAYGGIRIRQVDADVARAPKARVGLVQANMSLMGKRRELAEGLRRHLTMTEDLKTRRALDLVVWSETSVMRAVDERELATRVPEQVSRRIGVPAIFGAVLIRPVAGPREYFAFNTALATDAAGEIRGRYDKQFLVTFSEYIPFGDTLPILYEWSPNSGRFSPGTSIDPLPVGSHKVATIICYEDLSPGFVNAMFRHQNAALLVNITNDAWFGDTIEPYQHLALSKLRAVEQRRFFVRSTNSGVSAFVDPVGRTISQTSTFRQQTLDHDIAWLDGKTPYRLFGEWLTWLLAAIGLAAAWVPKERLGRFRRTSP
jgi:apolipoprotein N-acyltransferase